MRNSYIKTVCFVLALMLLSTCGTKGPLYIPEQQYPQDTPEAAPQPAQNAPASNN